MKKSIFIIPLLIVIIGVFIFFNMDSSDENILEGDLQASLGDESLYIDDGVVYVKQSNTREEVGKFDEEIEKLTWSNDGKYFLVDTVENTYLYIRDGIILSKEFKTNGNTIFSNDSRKLLLGVKDKHNDLAIYNIESKYIEQILEGKDKEVYIPKSWEDETINYIEKNSNSERQLVLEETEEDKLMDLLKEDGNHKQVISLLASVDRNNLIKKYGDNSIIGVLEYLSRQEIRDKESMIDMIGLSDSFVGQEHYKYMEVLGEMYLSDINNFIKALTANESKTNEIAYGLHDLKLYERLDSDLTEDLNSIIRSKDLTAKEKEIGMNLISSYSDCEA